MARSRGSSPRFARSRRLTGWDLGPGGTAATSLSASAALVLGSGVIILQDGLTLVRTRGRLSVILNTSANLGEGFQGAMGIGITTAQAFSDIGITALPHPIDEVDWDGWLFHTFLGVHEGLAAATNGSGNIDYEVDSKAMRKLTENMVIFAAIQVVEIGVSTAKVHFDSRCLFKLP